MGDFYYFGHVDGKQPALGPEFYNSALPTMFIAALIWLFSTMYYGGYLPGIPAFDITSHMTQLITYIIIYAVSWLFLFFLALFRVNTIAMIVFFVNSYFTGFLHSFALDYVVNDLGVPVEIASSLFVTSAILGVFATGGAMLLGFMFKDKISEHYCIYFMLFGVLFSIVELVMYVVFGLSNLLVDLLLFVYAFGVTVFDAATIPGKIKRGYWMMAAIDIFFDYVIMVMRIFIILVQLWAKKH